MVEDSLRKINHALGVLEERVANLQGLFETERTYTHSERSKMRETVAALSQSVRDLNTTQTNWNEEWRTEWLPVLRGYILARNHAEGRASLGKGILALVVGLSSVMGALLGWMLNHFH